MPTYVSNMIKRYNEQNPARFHMPGHKATGCANAAMDITEIAFTDDLYHPQSVLLNAQAQLAQACGAAASFFLVGGSTAGIQAMLLASGAKKVIVSRDAHRAAVNACGLFGIDPVWAAGRWNAEENIAESPEEVLLRKMEEYPEVPVLVTAPDYYGRQLAVERIKEQARGALILADAAHGAHLYASPRFPAPAARWADYAVESPHKTLNALTQAAWIHAGSLPLAEKLAPWLPMVQTSSPSFLLMASLDTAREELENGRVAWERLWERCQVFAHRVAAMGFRVWTDHDVKRMGYRAQDATRLVVDVRAAGISGFGAVEALSNQGVETEMADGYRVVGIATPWNREEDFLRFEAGLRSLAEASAGKEYRAVYGALPVWHQVMPVPAAVRAPRRRVLLQKAVDKVAAVSFGAYPPGIPLAMPGEAISHEIIEHMAHVESLGGHFFGVENGMVWVVDE